MPRAGETRDACGSAGVARCLAAWRRCRALVFATVGPGEAWGVRARSLECRGDYAGGGSIKRLRVAVSPRLRPLWAEGAALALRMQTAARGCAVHTSVASEEWDGRLVDLVWVRKRPGGGGRVCMEGSMANEGGG